METLISLLAVANKLSPLAIIALLVGVVGLLVWKSPLKPIEDSLHEVKINHLHELPMMAADIKTAVEVLQRIEVRMADDFSYIKARLD